MGKLGKSLKRKRSEQEQLVNEDVLPILQEEDDKTLSLSIEALEMFSKRLDLYSSPRNKALRVLLYPLLQEQQDKGAHFEHPLWKGSLPPNDKIADSVIGLASRPLSSLIQLLSGPLSQAGWKDLFASSIFKSFRRALHPLVLEKNRKEGKVLNTCIDRQGLSSKVSDAFRRHDWRSALCLLKQLEDSTELPKLGSMQRWVRECDLAAQDVQEVSNPIDHKNEYEKGFEEEINRKDDGMKDNVQDVSLQKERNSLVQDISYSSSTSDRSRGSNTALLLLDAIMRTCIKTGKEKEIMSKKNLSHLLSPQTQKCHLTTTIVSDPLSLIARLTRTPIFTLSDDNTNLEEQVNDNSCTSSSTSDVEKQLQTTHVTKDEIVKAVSVLSFVSGPERRPPSSDDLYIYAISPKILDLSDTLKTLVKRYEVPLVPGAFVLDKVLSPLECAHIIHVADSIGFQRDGIDGIGALVWLANSSAVLDVLFKRVKDLLPQEINGCILKGLNARFRLFRYTPGAVYRPHIDGSWPGSGLDEKGNLTNDAFPGERISRLTFLIYLNGCFDGGATTFFLPSKNERGHILAHSVQPKQGSVLCFPHGDYADALIHEGSAVEPGGVKYIIRTDVLYSTK
jgi:hypothetical protein